MLILKKSQQTTIKANMQRVNESFHQCRRYRSYVPRRKKTCLREFANNKSADQPAHPRSQIRAFFIRFLESTISKLATREISVFLLVPVCGQAGFESHFIGNPEDRFCHDEAHTIRQYKLTLRNLADHLMYKCRSAQCVCTMLCLISCLEITTDPLNYCFKRTCRKYISKLLKVKPIRILCIKSICKK